MKNMKSMHDSVKSAADGGGNPSPENDDDDEEPPSKDKRNATIDTRTSSGPSVKKMNSMLDSVKSAADGGENPSSENDDDNDAPPAKDKRNATMVPRTSSGPSLNKMESMLDSAKSVADGGGNPNPDNDDDDDEPPAKDERNATIVPRLKSGQLLYAIHRFIISDTGTIGMNIAKLHPQKNVLLTESMLIQWRIDMALKWAMRSWHRSWQSQGQRQITMIFILSSSMPPNTALV